MVTPLSIRHLDEDTVLVTVVDGPHSTLERDLSQTLHEAEQFGKPALIVDLSAVEDPSAGVLRAVAACQRRCIVNGRWMLVVPPYPPTTAVPRTD